MNTTITSATPTTTPTTTPTVTNGDTSTLPHLAGDVFVTDGGLETTLVFHDGIDLPEFAAFPLVDDEQGRASLSAYYEPYFAIASRDGVGMVVDTPTWRANADWGPRLGYDHDELEAANVRSVEFVRGLADAWTEVETVINGVIGPRGDGYVVEQRMSPSESAAYHSLQARAFARAGADMITAVTMTSADEATGVVLAARDAGLEVAVGFTVETDGALPSGESLGEAITAVDAATGGVAAYFMINCAHTTHFADALDTEAPWLGRIKAIRANASSASHEELDEAEELDRGDPERLAADYSALLGALPDLRLVGGCCGTDDEHIGLISACIRSASPA